MKIKDLDQLRCFNLIYETKSLTKTAQRMGISKAAVAKRLGIFEAEIGVKLFRRSTRMIAPTSEGIELYNKAKTLMACIEEFEDSVEEDSSLKGPIRITATNSIAEKFLAKELLKFQKNYPEIKIELVVTNSILDLVENNIDLALRINPSKSSQLVGKKLGDHHLKIVASKKYLKTNGPIPKLGDLSKHPILTMPQHLEMRFSKSKTRLKDLLVSSKNFSTNDPGVMTRLILDHEAIGVRSTWDIKSDLKDGSLVELFPNDPLEHLGEIWLLSSTGRMQTKRVRALFDYLVKVSPGYIE